MALAEPLPLRVSPPIYAGAPRHNFLMKWKKKSSHKSEYVVVSGSDPRAYNSVKAGMRCVPPRTRRGGASTGKGRGVSD